MEKYTVGEEYYLENGRCVEYVGMAGKKFIVKPLLTSGDEEPWYGKEMIIDEKLYTEPIQERFHEIASNLHSEINEASETLRKIRSEIRVANKTKSESENAISGLVDIKRFMGKTWYFSKKKLNPLVCYKAKQVTPKIEITRTGEVSLAAVDVWGQDSRIDELDDSVGEFGFFFTEQEAKDYTFERVRKYIHSEKVPYWFWDVLRTLSDKRKCGVGKDIPEDICKWLDEWPERERQEKIEIAQVALEKAKANLKALTK